VRGRYNDVCHNAIAAYSDTASLVNAFPALDLLRRACLTTADFSIRIAPSARREGFGVGADSRA